MNQSQVSDINNNIANVARGMSKTRSLKEYAKYMAYMYDNARRKEFLDKTFNMLNIPQRFR